MPDTYLSRILKGLERMYQFPSAQKGAPSDVELDLPIQVVQDVDGLATMGAGVGRQNGFWLWNVGITHVATGSIIATPNPFLPAVAGNGFPAIIDARDDSIWLYDIWGNSDDIGDVNSVMVSHAHGSIAVGPSNGVGGPQVWQPMFYATASNDSAFTPLSTARYFPTWPIRILRNEGGGAADSFMRFRSIADNAGTVTNTMQMMIWLGPKGVSPPVGGK